MKFIELVKIFLSLTKNKENGILQRKLQDLLRQEILKHINTAIRRYPASSDLRNSLITAFVEKENKYAYTALENCLGREIKKADTQLSELGKRCLIKLMRRDNISLSELLEKRKILKRFHIKNEFYTLEVTLVKKLENYKFQDIKLEYKKNILLGKDMDTSINKMLLQGMLSKAEFTTEEKNLIYQEQYDIDCWTGMKVLFG